MSSVVTLIGNLATVPKLVEGEKTIAKFNLAVNRGFESETDFVNVTVKAGVHSEACHNTLMKGDWVQVIGNLKTGFKGRDGEKHQATEVVNATVSWDPSKKRSNELISHVTFTLKAICGDCGREPECEGCRIAALRVLIEKFFNK